MTERTYYFQIRKANVIEPITACSFFEAKAIAAESWLEWWSDIEWLNPEEDGVSTKNHT